jgi:hypothetical protein
MYRARLRACRGSCINLLVVLNNTASMFSGSYFEFWWHTLADPRKQPADTVTGFEGQHSMYREPCRCPVDRRPSYAGLPGPEQGVLASDTDS